MRKTIRAFAQLALFILFLPARLSAVCDQVWAADIFGNLVIINAETQTQISAFMPGDEEASGITFTPDGTQVFLTDAGDGIWAINASTQASTQIYDQPGSNDIVMNPNGQFAYVAVGVSGMGAILQVNVATNAVTVLNATIPVSLNGIAIAPNGSQLYAVGENTLFVIDPSNGNILQTITIPSAMDLFKIAVTPNGALAYVTDGSGIVFQINLSNFSVATVSTDGFLSFSSPWGVTINPNGQFAYVTDEGNNSVYVINIASNTVVNVVSNPSFNALKGIAIDPTGSFLYVVNFEPPDNVVFAINTSTFAVNPITTSAFQPIVVAVAPACVNVTSTIKGRIVENKDFWQTNIFSELCWNAPVGFSPTHYLIFRNGKQVGVINGNRTSFKDNYLRPDKTYSYSVFAVNAAGMQVLIGTIILNTE